MDELIKQAPYIAALVIIVWVFLNAQAKRDALFLETQTKRDDLFIAELRSITEQLRVMQDKLSEHSEETTQGIAEMHRVTSRKRNANK